MFMVDDIGSICGSTQQKVECMDYTVRGRHVRLGEIAVEEFDCVREKKMIGEGIDHVEA